MKTLLIEELLNGSSHVLNRSSQVFFHKGLKLAQQSNIPMLRFLLDRVWPRAKDAAVRTGPLPIGTPEQLLETQENVMRKLELGELTPNQAEQIFSLLDSRRRLLETLELAQRVRAIEDMFETGRNNLPQRLCGAE